MKASYQKRQEHSVFRREGLLRTCWIPAYGSPTVKRAVRLHLSPSLGHRKIVSSRPVQIQRLYKEELDSGLSRRSVEYIHAVLNRAMKQAVRWEILPRDVCETAEPPHLSKRDKSPRSPTDTAASVLCSPNPP
jgi:hypothetical protein